MQLNCKLYCTFTSGNFYIHEKRYWAFLIGSWCLSVGMQAAKVDTLSVHSDAMNKEVQVITICPDKAMAGEKCPVLYLLHGYGGNAGTWLGIKPELPRIADKEGIILFVRTGRTVGIGTAL